jgi:hypothetical protein
MKPAYLAGYLKRDIIRWINRNSIGNNLNLSDWYCGITNRRDFDELQQYAIGRNVKDLYFRKWDANSNSISHEIELYFTKNGMKNKPQKGNPRVDQVYVFVFNANVAMPDEVLKLIG